MQPWKTQARRVILQQPRFLTVEMHTVTLPDGVQINDWAWLITPDFVNVVVVTEDGAFVVFRQTKYAVNGTTLAPVGGYIEPDEDPLLAAKREVLEETGYQAPTWTYLGTYAVDGNRGAGNAHLYLATGARAVSEPDADDLEEQELLLLSRGEMAQALHDGAFKVLPWSTVVALALMHMS